MQYRRRHISPTCALALGLMASSVAVAQQTPAPSPAAPPAPPSWAQGRASGQDKSPLAPHNAPLTAKKAEEIPVDKLKVPDGFEVSLWASGMPNARSMTLGEKGTLFVGTRLVGRVFAVVDRDGGWLEGENFWGRVADVQVIRDGSLLVSDDWNGAIFRVSRKR